MTISRIFESLEEFVKRFRNPLQLLDFVLTSSLDSVELSLVRNDSGKISWLLVVYPNSMKVMRASFEEKDYKEVIFNSEFEFFYKFIILFAPIYSRIGKGGLNSILSKFLSKDVKSWYSYLLVLSDIIGDRSVEIVKMSPTTMRIGKNTFTYDGKKATISNPIDISISVESMIELFSISSVFFDLVLTTSEVEDFNFFLMNSIKEVEEAILEQEKELEEQKENFLYHPEEFNQEAGIVEDPLIDTSTTIPTTTVPTEV